MHCYICGHAQEPGVGRCDRCDTRLRAPETAILPTALEIYNATRATASASPDIASMLIAAAAEGPESPEVTSQRGMDAPRDQPNEEQSVEPDEAKSFDFDALFTPAVPAEELESETSNGDVEAPKRASVL
jgi:hypothetical protein